MRKFIFFALGCVALSLSATPLAGAQNGADLYKLHCATGREIEKENI